MPGVAQNTAVAGGRETHVDLLAFVGIEPQREHGAHGFVVFRRLLVFFKGLRACFTHHLADESS